MIHLQPLFCLIFGALSVVLISLSWLSLTCHLKCDENKPICKKCEIHGQSCSYLQTHPLKRGPPTVASMLSPPHPPSGSGSISPVLSVPAPVLLPPALPMNFTMTDLELLHFWTTKSIASFVDFPSCITLFQTTVVEIALTHPFLMHEILSLAALHLSDLKPARSGHYRHASDTHLATGLSQFQPEIANLSTENCHACYAYAVMIFTHTWASQEIDKPSTLFFAPSSMHQELDCVPVQWIKLHRGSNEIMDSLSYVITEGPLEPLFRPWKGLDPNRPDPLPPIEEEQLSKLPNSWSSSSLSSGDKETLNSVLKSLRRVFNILAYSQNISKLSAVMSWFSMLTENYIRMLKDKVPEALLVVVFYCVALKRAEHMWWVKGKGENLIRTVMGELGEEWEQWTRWPVDQVLGPGGDRAYFSKEASWDIK
jgi:hypothetical protein